MIDKLSLTTFRSPDKEYLELWGTLTEDKYRAKLYRDMYSLDKAVVSYYPHKFSEIVNMQIPSTKIDINPKNFECFNHMIAYICSIFGTSDIRLEEFNVTRADLAADIEDFPIGIILCILHVQKIRSDGFSFFKGTVYAGSDPKIRIYDKTKHLKAIMRKGYKPTEYEKRLLTSDKSYTRFEVQKRHLKMNLKQFGDNPLCTLHYFDNLDIFNFEDGFNSGVLQQIYRLIPRKSRNLLDQYKNKNIIEEIKNQCRDSVADWLSDKQPF